LLSGGGGGVRGETGVSVEGDKDGVRPEGEEGLNIFVWPGEGWGLLVPLLPLREGVRGKRRKRKKTGRKGR
jgi:hypothetical protein